MKKVSNRSYKNFAPILLCSCLLSQEPFLEIRPYTPPSFEQYSVSHNIDHHYPQTNQIDDLFLRFDGMEFTENLLYPDCLSGLSCYDGHAGVDYYMPFYNPILAPADGYVLWASFSPPADPCPGGITPNGDQGTIIIAHGNSYYTVYLHMADPLTVSVGDNVTTGDTLGFNGNTGCAINAHLHFEVRKDHWFFDSNEPYTVDPFGWWHNNADPIEEFRNNRSEWLWVSDLSVDDGDNGFQRFQGPEWTYLNSGFNNDCWVAPSVNNFSDSRHYAIWVPYLENAGEYNIEIFIPNGVDAATEAIYELYIKNEDGTSLQTDFVVNQRSNPDNFTVFTTAELPSGSNCSIILRDVVNPSSTGLNVVFDAIRFTPTFSSISSEKFDADHINARKIIIESVFPNPFNSSTTIRYNIKEKGQVNISIFNSSGKRIRYVYNNNQTSGTYHFNWDGKSQSGYSLSSGLYFFSIESNGESTVKKLVYLK